MKGESRVVELSSCLFSKMPLFSSLSTREGANSNSNTTNGNNPVTSVGLFNNLNMGHLRQRMSQADVTGNGTASQKLAPKQPRLRKGEDL